jgi:hypothetical protein
VSAPEDEAPAALDIEAIRARHAAATPGPYRWAGNTDYGDVRLAAAGGSEVFALVERDRSHDDPESRAYASYLRDIQMKIDGEFRSLTDDEITAEVHRSIVQDEDDGDGNELFKTYKALAFYAPGFAYEHAVDRVTYEVTRYQDLPEDTPRSHPQIYRADVVDVRNPNARFLRDSWEDVRQLLAEVERLRDELEIRTAERDSAIVANRGLGRERDQARAEAEAANGQAARLGLLHAQEGMQARVALQGVVDSIDAAEAVGEVDTAVLAARNVAGVALAELQR